MYLNAYTHTYIHSEGRGIHCGGKILIQVTIGNTAYVGGYVLGMWRDIIIKIKKIMIIKMV